MRNKLKQAVLTGALFIFTVSVCLILLELFLERYPQFLPEQIKIEITQKKLVKYWMKNVYAKWYTNWVDDETLGLKRPPNYHYKVEPDFYGEAVWACLTDPVTEPCGGVDVYYDKDGFRNTGEVRKADIVTLGDSLTEGFYLKTPWPNILGKLLNVQVYNLGMGHFGAVQERLSFLEYGAARKPRLVILAFYEGNDLDDNEQFDAVKKSGLPWHVYDKAKVNRSLAEEKFSIRKTIIWTACEYACERLFKADETRRKEATPGSKGWFTYDSPKGANGFALTGKIYSVILSKEQLGSKPGWVMTKDSLRGLREDCRKAGASFLAVYIPTQERVVLPYMLKTMSDDYFNQQVAIIFKESKPSKDYAALFRMNSENIEEMLSGFCREEKINYLDLTPELRKEAASGSPVYFPRDSHFNEHGAEISAREIHKYIKANLWKE